MKRITAGACVLILLIAVALVIGMSATATDQQIPRSWTSPSTSVALVDVFPDEVWEYWEYEDLKGLDPWGDSESAAMDIVAVYDKEEPDSLQFRLDFLDLPTDVITPTFFALDFTAGGTTLIEPGNGTVTFDIEWDLMVSISGTNFTLVDSTFTQHPELLLDAQIDRQLDFVAFAVARGAFAGWDGSAFEMQALATDQEGAVVLDRLAPVATDGTTGRAKLVWYVGSVGNYQAPYGIHCYDGYSCYRTDERPGELRGFRYVLDAVEKYRVPIVDIDLRLDTLPGLDYLRISDRIRDLAAESLIDALSTLGYGHHMLWQPDDIDAKAVELATEMRQDLELPSSTVFYPYEAMITPGDIQVIKDAGYGAIFGHNQYRYWFGWIEDWSDLESAEAEIKSLRKIHVIDGIPFLFDTRSPNYGGFAWWDPRWGDINWDEWSEAQQFEGTDQGLDLWWRRVLHDMAIDPDQEQFFTIGTDIGIAGWIFPDVVDWNFRWLASHPWIEVTTFSSILDRGWSVIDHGNLELAPDELLIQYQPDGDIFYNAYFPLYYYGGVSDGHSPLIPAGVEIEAFNEYVPYLRDGVLIQPARIMGDDQTPGSVIHETLENLRAMPDNPVAELAWLSYFMHIGEQTWHDGALLSDRAKLQANFLLQVNKIAYAAQWADDAAKGVLSAQTQVLEQDLDLDGELEYIMSNDRVLAIFENDGGRLEYAFAYDARYGSVQLVSPRHQYYFKPQSEQGFDYTNGEVAIPVSGPYNIDGAFVDHKIGVGNQYDPYEALPASSSLSFVSASIPVTKTFTLDGDTIHAQYQIGSGEQMIHVFGFYVNRSGVFAKDWSESYEAVVLPGSLGWQMTTGGSALVNFEGVILGNKASFIDSPARDEMQEREDQSTYPPGHGYCFPSSSVDFWNDGSGSLSLSLRASPLRPVHLPLIVRND